MTTRRANIYLIRHLRGAASLVVLVALLALAPASALAQCDDAGGAGDEYCESLPGAGGDREVGAPNAGAGEDGDAAPGKLKGGLSDATSRSLEQAGAGAVRQVKSPVSEGRSAGGAQTASAAPDAGIGEAGGGSVLPYILAGLTLALLLAALLRRRRGSGTSQDPPTT